MARGGSPGDGSRPANTSSDDALRAALSDLAGRSGFDVEDITVRLQGGRRLIRVAVDRDGGVDLEAAAHLSRDMSAALDDEYDDVLGDAAYTLEVTSRGVGAPLTAPRHFRRSIGRLVTFVWKDGTSSTGRIARVDDSSMVLLAGPDGTQPLTVRLADVASAKAEAEFTPMPERVASVLQGFGGSPTDSAASSLDEPRIEGDDAR